MSLKKSLFSCNYFYISLPKCPPEVFILKTTQNKGGRYHFLLKRVKTEKVRGCKMSLWRLGDRGGGRVSLRFWGVVGVVDVTLNRRPMSIYYSVFF